MSASRGALLCFTGVDGSGKTTQARWLVEWLRRQGYDGQYVWSRGEARWRRPLLSLGRLVLRAPSTQTSPIAGQQRGYDAYHARKARLFRSRSARWVWGELVRLEHAIQIRASVVPALRAGAVVVTDRYLWDSIVDLAVAFGAGEEWLLGCQSHYTLRLVPLPDLSLFLDVPVETALARKNDIPSSDYIARRVGLYQALAANRDMVHLDGCLDAPLIHREVVRHGQAVLSARGIALYG